MHRQADQPAVIRQSTRHRLANPPVDIGAESKAFAPVELVDTRLQANVALLDEVRQAQALAAVASSNGHHQPQVGFDEPLACLRTFCASTFAHLSCGLALLLWSKQRVLGDLAEI